MVLRAICYLTTKNQVSPVHSDYSNFNVMPIQNQKHIKKSDLPIAIARLHCCLTVCVHASVRFGRCQIGSTANILKKLTSVGARLQVLNESRFSSFNLLFIFQFRTKCEILSF